MRVLPRNLRSISPSDVLILFIPVIILLPAAFLIFGSLWSSVPGEAGWFTLEHYREVASNPLTWRLLLNSLIYAASSALLATAIGGLLAFIVTRTDAPFRSVVGWVPLATLVLPSMVDNLAWIFLLSPRNGLINLMVERVLGIEGPIFNIYSMPGMIWVMGTGLIPLVYILISGSLALIDPELEESSRVAGAGVLTTFRRIILPLITPAVASAYLLALIISLESFETPAMIGLPGRIEVFTAIIYVHISGLIPPEYGVATAYANILVLITSLFLLIYWHVTRMADRFVTVTGRAARAKVISLGRWRWLAALFLIVYVLVHPVPIFTTLVIASLHSFWNPDFLFKNMTLENFRLLFLYPTFLTGIANSLIVSITSALIATGGAVLLSYKFIKRGGSLGKLLEFFASVPLAFPTIVLGVGLLWFLITLPIGIYGTVWALTFAYTARFLPYALRFLSGPTMQLHRELEEASRLSGAGFMMTLRRITIPILKPSLLGSFVYVMVVSIKDLGAAVMLVTSESVVLSSAVFSLWNAGETMITVAGSLVFVAVLVVVVLITKLLLKVSPYTLVRPEHRASV